MELSIKNYSEINRNNQFVYRKCKNCKQIVPDLSFMLNTYPKCLFCQFIKNKDNKVIRNHLKSKVKRLNNEKLNL